MEKYKIKILHIINPHLIWAETVSDDQKTFKYLQLGIDGILPLSPHIDSVAKEIKFIPSSKWTQGTTVIIYECLQDAVSIWFELNFIDHRDTIFDTTDHLYGDIIVKTKNGSLVKLSNILINGNVAYKDQGVFNQYLGNGKHCTRLQDHETNEVVASIEKAIRNDKITNNRIANDEIVKKRIDALHGRLTVFFQVHHLIEEFEKRSDTKQYIGNLNETFKYIKDSDELSYGRACRLNTKRKNSDSKDSMSGQEDIEDENTVRMKRTQNWIDQFDNLKLKGFADDCYSENAPEEEAPRVSKFFTKRNRSFNNITNEGLQSESQGISAVSKFFTKRNIITIPETKITDSSGNNIDSDNSTNTTLQSESHKPSAVSKFFTRRNITTAPEQKSTDTGLSNINSDDNISNKISQKGNDSPGSVSKFFAKRNIKSTPERDITDASRTNIVSDNNNTKTNLLSNSNSAASNFLVKKNLPEPEITDTSRSNIVSNNNSTNTSLQAKSNFFENGIISTTAKQKTRDTNRSNIESEKYITKTNIQTKSRSDANISKTNNDNNKSSTNEGEKQISGLAENKLNEVKKCSPSKLDNATVIEKPISKFVKKLLLMNSANNATSADLELDKMPTVQKFRRCNSIVSNSDNESTASCLLDRIERLDPQTEIATEKPEKIKITVKNNTHANVFNNMSPSISKFVDRLVTPVLMVHTKHNERIEPLVDLREFNFNQTIRSTLSSMSVKSPMMIQSLSWYSILRGYSTFMISPLNSGKTLGYTPPVCQLVLHCKDDIELTAGQGPICVIMCATASSVVRVARQCRSFLKNQKTVLSCYPGVNEKEMTMLLLNGCDIFVCTPCALVRFLTKTDFSLDLKRMTVCVFDNFERLDEVYINEVKYLLLKIKERHSTSAEKSYKVQFIIASRTWCSIFEKLAKKFSHTVICIGAYQECVLYSKAHTTVSFVQRKNKISKVIDFFNDIDSRKRAVVVCRTDEEVREVAIALTEQHRVVLSADNTMTVEVLCRLSTDWFQYDDPIIAPVLVCCDSNLAHLNITNACYLFHYSLPNLYSMFCKRFSSLTDHLPSLFEENAQNNVRIGIILEENNAEQLPKIVNFIRRCKNEVPAILNEITESVNLEKDRLKAESLVPVCDKLLLFGQCAEYWNCTERHSLFKEYDSPQDWCPKSGVISFIILHYKNAVTYSVRLLSNVANGVTNKYPQNYATLCLKMGLYYSKEDNKLPHGIPKIGDVCAVGINAYKFERCQIVKILSTHRNGNPNHVLVKLIDEEKWERTKDIDLYHLPDHLKNIISYVVEVKLCGLQPKDRDVMFSELAEMHLKGLLRKEKAFYIRANVVAVVGNNIMVDNLNVCQELSSLKTTVVRYNFKEELMRNHALENKEHIPKLLEICQIRGLIVKDDIEVPSKAKAPSTSKHLPEPQWAHLDKGELSVVYFASAEHPGKFFVRHVKFDDCLQLLTNDIQKYISEGNVEPVAEVLVDQCVLAKFPDDSLYYRARVDAIGDTRIKCFFVDHGDWRFVNIKDIYELTEGFIKQIPFQAIECRLVALKPPGDEWPEISTNWLCNLCFIGDSEDSKQLYVKYFTKETAENTDGYKYGIIVIDTTSNQDLVFNQSMLDANFAQADDDEIQYLDDCMRTLKITVDNNISEEKQWELEAEPYLDKKFVRKLDDNNQLEGSQGSLMNSLFAKVPQKYMTFEDEDYDSDRWEMQMDVREVSKSLGLLPSTPNSGPSVTPENFVKIDSAETNSDFEMLSPVPKIVELPDTEPKVKELSPEPKVKELPPEPKVKELSPDLAETNSDFEMLSLVPKIVELPDTEPKVKELSPEPKVKELSPEPKVKELSPDSAETNSDFEMLSPVPKIVELPDTEPKVKELSPEPKVKELSPEPKVKELSPDSVETNSDFEMLSPVPEIVELPDTEPKVKELSPEPKVKELSPKPKVKELSPEPKVKELSPEPKCKELLKPKVNWYQKDSIVVIKIEVLGMLHYDMDIAQRSLSFKAAVHDKVYGFKLNMYGIVDPVKSTHAHKGLYVQVKLAKLLNRKWLSLYGDEAKIKWITYDQDALDYSSDDDESDQRVSKETLKNIVEATYYNSESDAESDIYFRDDLEQKYKYDSD